MSKKVLNCSFYCENCGSLVQPLSNGSYRNHCPFCLYSKHLDELPGDRSNDCKGLMKPIGINYHAKKGYQLIHQCLSCGVRKVNKIATNTIQEDDLEIVLNLIQK